MQVAVFANPYQGTAPYLSVLSGTNDIEAAAEASLEAEGIPYQIIDSDDLPECGQLANAATVDLSGPEPVFGYYMPYATELSTYINTSYWEAQSQQALAELRMAPYQLAVALSVPEAERTMEQQVAVEALNEISTQQTTVQGQINSATTGEELLQILAQLG